MGFQALPWLLSTSYSFRQEGKTVLPPEVIH